MLEQSLNKDIAHFFKEDDFGRNAFYFSELPRDSVKCQLKIKDDIVLSGMAWFIASFKYLDPTISLTSIMEFEKNFFSKGSQINFILPFNVALTAERIALNLLQHASAISTFTYELVKLTEGTSIKLLDTRKTTPGLRALEKYAVRVGGGYNHRLAQTDAFMIKDNHKSFFGGVEKAVNFFKGMQSFYTPIILEVHSMDELEQGFSLGVKHYLLDNFSPDEIRQAIKIKNETVTYEVSGGITPENIEEYLMEGINAISMGCLTYAAPSVDISLKYKR